MTGAVAVNNVNSIVVSNIASTENLTGTINNSAEKTGALIAAGLGLTVSNASSESSNYTGAASANVNLSDNVVKAVLKDNTAINSSAIKNVASNDVNAIIDGGTYKTSGAINNIVSTTLTDVAGGVGVSVAQGSESSYGFQGVFTYNKIKNNSHADIKNVDITANALVNSSSDDKNAVNAYNKNLTGALAVAGAGDGAAQASLAISDVDNDFKAEVTNSTLNIKNKTDINATSNTLDRGGGCGCLFQRLRRGRFRFPADHR